ncbi:hypothetical protein NDU88_000866 [Pleurodeles waltl]|uniref:Uncharacterized protein n=1 Tax=Pleurodeles waltl TaxID=8319 RepID=A0AAV7WGQ3_PLEWA|nr:hypothetical protein NDU88_000866 [Pleurodeles waltl]
MPPWLPRLSRTPDAPGGPCQPQLLRQPDRVVWLPEGATLPPQLLQLRPCRVSSDNEMLQPARQCTKMMDKMTSYRPATSRYVTSIKMVAGSLNYLF